jgi:hypothetical protein
VTPLDVDAPPETVDDIWTEEVVVKGNIIAGNTLSIVGNGKTILEFAKAAGIDISSTLVPRLFTAEAEAPASSLSRLPASLPPLPAFGAPPPRLLPPRSALLQSSRAPVTHQGPREPRREEHRLPAGAQSYAPRPAHTGPRPYAPPSRHIPTSAHPSRPQTGPPRPGLAHGGEGRRHYEPRRTDLRPRSQACLVVEE